MIAAREALERLREGNGRFASGARSSDILTSQTRRSELAAGQKPFAIILGCSDSQVPAEIVFDQGVGDLFVIRGARDIVASSLVGSVETGAVDSFDDVPGDRQIRDRLFIPMTVLLK